MIAVVQEHVFWYVWVVGQLLVQPFLTRHLVRKARSKKMQVLLRRRWRSPRHATDLIAEEVGAEAAEEEGVVVPTIYSLAAAVAVDEQVGVLVRSGQPFLLQGAMGGMALEQAG